LALCGDDGKARAENPEGQRLRRTGGGKSDRPIDTEEAGEQRQVGFLPAEAVEEGGLAKGNLFQQNKFWAQYRQRIGRDG